MMTSETEIKNCSFIKTVLMLIIVFYHSILFWTGTWFTVVGKPVFECAIFKYISFWLGTFHVYTFTLISGYIFYYLKVEKQKYSCFKIFLLNKCKRLLIPYCFISIFWIVPVKLFFEGKNIVEHLINVFLGIGGAQLWYLVMLFLVFVISYQILPLILQENIKSRILVFLIIVICLGGNLVWNYFRIPNYFQVNNVLKHLPFFILGIKIRQKQDLWIRKVPKILYFILDIFLCMLTFLLKKYNGLFSIFRTMIEILLNFTSVLMVFFILQKLAERLTINEKILLFFSRRAMPIYMFHQQFIYFVIFFLNGKVTPYAHALANFLISLFLSIIISSILLVFKTTRLMIGEK